MELEEHWLLGRFGGIAMCLRLRRLGYQVTVVDNNPKVGAELKFTN